MHCKNCETAMALDSNYCHNCGGRIIRNRLTLKNLFEHISETFFNYDNKLLRTIICLIKNPEDVIGSYVNGVRKKYVNPISFFGLSITLTGLSIFFIKKFYIQYLDFSSFSDGYKNEASRKMTKNLASDSLEYSSLIYSGLIPVLALISFIIFYKKAYNFTEHIVLYLYSMSLFSLVSVIFGHLILIIVPSQYLLFSFAMYIIAFFYHCFLLKRVFELSISELVLKSILFLILFFALYIGISILVFAILMLSGNINLQDFAPK